MPTLFTLASEFTRADLEATLMATIAANPAVYFEVIDLLPAEALTSSRATYLALAAAIEGGNPLPTVEGEPTADPLALAEELAGLYQKRLLADLAQRFLEDLRGDTDAAALMLKLEEGLSQTQQAVRELTAGQVVALPDLLAEVVNDATARREAVREFGSAAVGLPTGLKRLDRLLGGLQPGVHVLAAEPGMGKTTFCLEIAANVSRAGFPALFVSFEETLLRLALKALCQAAGLVAKRFADGYGNPLELAEAAETYGPQLANVHFVQGMGRLTVMQVRAKALQIMARKRAKRCLIVVDYLQRWAAGRREAADFRHVVSGLVGELRELSLRLDSPVLVISSLNRPGYDKPQLASLKESGDIEFSADTATFLVESKRTTLPPARAVDLAVEKNRYGDRGRVELIFRPDVGQFRQEAG